MSSSASRLFSALPVRVEAGESHMRAFSPRTRVGEGSSQPGRELTVGQASSDDCSNSHKSDEALMVLVCDGRKEALAELFHRYGRIVRGIAFRVLRDTSEADDLLQDVFLLIHRLCRTFDSSRGSARFWILQMTHHRAISRRRYLTSRHFYDRKGLGSGMDGSSEQITESVGASPIPDEILEKQEILSRWFEELSPDQQETLQLFFFEGCSFKEIAAKLGQTTANARNHYYRGLDRLRKRIFSGELPGWKHYDKRFQP